MLRSAMSAFNRQNHQCRPIVGISIPQTLAFLSR